MAKRPALDPRFDPRFQRGYDGPEPAVPEVPSTREPAPPSTREPGRRSTPEPEPPSTPGSAVPSTSATPAPIEPDDAFWEPPRRNPFAIALLIGSLAMIAVGLWLIWSVVTVSSYPDGYDRGAQAFGLVQQQLTPALLITGLLGVIGWFVLGALAASDRNRS